MIMRIACIMTISVVIPTCVFAVNPIVIFSHVSDLLVHDCEQLACGPVCPGGKLDWKC